MNEYQWNEWLFTGVSINKTKSVFIYSVDGYSNGAFAILDADFFNQPKEFKETKLKSLHITLSNENRKNNYIPIR